MRVRAVYYNQRFEIQFRGLSRDIQKKAVKAEKLFRANPFYPSLRLHKLHGKLQGLWSISLDFRYRIIFQSLENGDILFISVGLHAIYDEEL